MTFVLEEVVLAVHVKAFFEHSDLMPETVHIAALLAAHEIIDTVIDIDPVTLPACELSACNGILLVDFSLKA